MRAIIAVLTFVLLQSFSYASTSSGIVIAVSNNSYAPAVKLQLLADYVAVPISINNDSTDPITRTNEIEKTVRIISEKLKQYPDLVLKPGIVSLSPRGHSAMKSSSSYDSSNRSSAQFYILGALKQDANVFAVTKRIYQVVSAISFADETKVNLGNTELGLSDPEKYREKILGAISKSIVETKKSLSIAGTVEIDGLENQVSVMQLNEKEVVLFINYKLKIQTK
jgi:hypothetical protein